MRTSKWVWAVLSASSLALGACGDDTGGGGGSDGSGGSSGEAGHDGAGGHGATQAATGASTSSSSTTSTGSGEVAPAAPVLDAIMAMHGALHLYWTNVADDCDQVEGERKATGEEFAVFFDVPGTVDNEADDAATDPATAYTYRLRCLRGETYSEYSNELTGSPE